MTSRDDQFSALLDASSLGTDAARRLRERTPPQTARVIRMIIQLRNDIAHGASRATAERAVEEIFNDLHCLTNDHTGLNALRDAVLRVRTRYSNQAIEAFSSALEALDLVRWDELDAAASQELQAALTVVIGRLATKDGLRPYTAQQPEPPTLRPSEDAIFLTVAEVAALLRVSKMAVYRMVHSGHLPATRVGRAFRISKAAVHEHLHSKAQP